MKTKNLNSKSRGIISLFIPLLIVSFSLLLVNNSCQKEDLVSDRSTSHLKTTTPENEDGYSLYYQNELFIRETGKPIIVTRKIGSPNLDYYEECFKLNVQSGVNDKDFVSAAVIKIDGAIVLNNPDFKNSNQLFQIELCNLTEASVMEVQIFGTPGSTLEIWIDGQLKNAGTFVDCHDGHVYKWIKIGSQIWMQENLAFLPSVSPSVNGSDLDPYYYVYDYEETSVSSAKATENYATYGVLYNWPAAMNGASSSSLNPSEVQGVCPCGWHLPSYSEWNELCELLGGVYVAGGKLKETGLEHWDSPNEGATNETGFTALPGGWRLFDGPFGGIGSYGLWWSSTEFSAGSSAAWGWVTFKDNSQTGGENVPKRYGFSVRCVKD
jgi:uncharacterized protein (TIGR02145 family)